MAELLEAVMVISFGISWPISIYKAWKSRTAKGVSPVFLIFILIGYACGIAAKIISGGMNYVFAFYILNFCMVAADLALYLRNAALDRRRAS